MLWRRRRCFPLHNILIIMLCARQAKVEEGDQIKNQIPYPKKWLLIQIPIFSRIIITLLTQKDLFYFSLFFYQFIFLGGTINQLLIWVLIKVPCQGRQGPFLYYVILQHNPIFVQIMLYIVEKRSRSTAWWWGLISTAIVVAENWEESSLEWKVRKAII